MGRWSDLTGRGSGAAYAARYAELASAGVEVPGEARLLTPG